MDKPYVERKAGSFVKDPETGELRRGDEAQPAKPKPATETAAAADKKGK